MTGEIPHPREVFDFAGGEAVETAFLTALERGRLHHAWLLVGPEGVGKATFAYRAARRLLGAAAEPALGLLGSSPDDPVSRQVAARSSPDLMVIEREGADGKPRKVIPVDEARAIPEFFSKSPARAPYRVAIIDAADDLNVNAANAVLKTLEEPPPRGVLLLVSHAPGGLLATLRSRCRRLRFEPPPEEAAAAWVAARAEISPEDALRLTRMAAGAPGRAWRLAGLGALKMDEAAGDLLRGLPRVDDSAMLALADGFRGGEGAARFNLLFERLADQVRAMAAGQALAGEGAPMERWAEAWEMLTRLPREVEAVNLDRADAFWTALSRLRAIA
jgi:DNA polymerase-3 subunit delta'